MRYQASAKAARALGPTVQALGVREPDDFDEAFSAMTKPFRRCMTICPMAS